jgi:hypothetical protein
MWEEKGGGKDGVVCVVRLDEEGGGIKGDEIERGRV